MSDRKPETKDEEKIGNTDVTREENVRTATHWGTPADPEEIQDSKELSDHSD